MKSIVLIPLTSGLMFANSAMATDMPNVATRNECGYCHEISKQVVGPAWKDVAAKYKDDAEAWTKNGKLAKKIKNGGNGSWGRMPMPANPKVSDEDMKEILAFIKGLAK